MGQDFKKLCDNLSSLCQLDKEDHERHIEDLSAAIRSFGEEPPEETPDLKGFIIEGFTAIRSMTGTEGALRAMKRNEELTNKTYEEALDWEMPEDAHQLIERNYSDERRHLAYIEATLEARSWEEDISAELPPTP